MIHDAGWPRVGSFLKTANRIWVVSYFHWNRALV